MSKMSEEFISVLEERSDGQLDITYLPGGALLGPVDMFDGVVNKIADVGFSHTGYYRGVFPVMDLLTMPLAFPDGWVDTHVVNDFYNKFMPAEFADTVHPMVFAGTSPKVLHMRDKKVETMADLSGLAIRAPGTAGEIMTALGAVPRPTPVSEWYESMSRGVLDGLNLPFEVISTWRMDEVTDYTLNSWQTGNIDLFFLVMNKGTYESMPANLQKIVDDTSAEFYEKYARAWVNDDVKGYEKQVSSGNEVYFLADAEAAKWVEAVQPVTDAYITELKTAYPGADVDGWVDFIKERIDYWTGEQIARGIKTPTGPDSVRL